MLLSWTPDPKAVYYTLSGSGITRTDLLRPGTVASINVTGANTYIVKALPPGPQSWTLLTVYSGPSGPYAVDPGNPARTSVTLVAKTGWYAYWLDGFQVQSATTDDMLNRDGWGDEVFLTIDVLETGPTGKLISASDRVPELGNFGDVGRSENKIMAGTASNTGGLKNADQYLGRPFPMRVWCGQLVEGQTGVAITSTIWEWNDTPGASFYDWMAFIKKHNTDLQSADVKKAGADMKSVLGNPGTRPIGMAANGTFTPRAIVLIDELAENSLSRAWLNQPAGTANINYKEPPGILNGEYTLKGRIVRVANPQECRQ